MTKYLNKRLFIVILLIISLVSCEKIANETDPTKIIIGKWEVIEIGNWPLMESVKQSGGYDEYVRDSIKIEYSSNPPESMQKNYWIDSLLHERVYLQEERRYVNTGIFKYEFFDKNQKMRLDYVAGIAELSTAIYKRLK